MFIYCINAGHFKTSEEVELIVIKSNVCYNPLFFLFLSLPYLLCLSKLKNYELHYWIINGNYHINFQIFQHQSISKHPCKITFIISNKNIHSVQVNEICVFTLFFRSEEFADLEAEFKPSLLNSTVYVISMSLQLSTFAINYRVNYIFPAILFLQNVLEY